MTLYKIIGIKNIKNVVDQVLQEIKAYEFLESNITIDDLKNSCENFIVYISNGPYEYDRKTNAFDLFLKMESIRFEEFKSSIVNVFNNMNIEEKYINLAIEKINKERLLLLEKE